MAQINDLHEAPVFLASRGHVRVGMAHPDTAPVAALAREQTPADRRRQTRVQAKARKREVRAGAPFLRRLTTTSVQTGIGEWQGEGAPSRLAGKLGVGYP